MVEKIKVADLGVVALDGGEDELRVVLVKYKCILVIFVLFTILSYTALNMGIVI